MATGARSKIEWEVWGEEDPLWGSAGWTGRELSGARPWTEERFYETGRLDWDELIRRWQVYGVDTQGCLEIACGAGRITRHMAATFENVFALDVSPGMVAYAKEHVGAGNVTYFLTDGHTVPLENESVSAVFSNHAFHHFNTVSDAERYFEEAVRVLTPGGSIMINLDVHEYTAPSLFGLGGQYIRLQRAMYSGVLKLTSVFAELRRRRLQRRNARDGSFLRLISYEIDWVFHTLDRIGFEDIEMSIFLMPQPAIESEDKELVRRRDTFVFARKPKSVPG